MRLIVYLDDWLIINRDPSTLLSDLEKAISLFVSLGLTINYKKAVLIPTQSIHFLGFTIDSVRFTFSVPANKRADIACQARTLLEKPQVRVREIARFIGKAEALSVAASILRLFLRPLQSWLGNLKLRRSEDYEKLLTIPKECRRDLRWIADNISSVASEPILNDPVALSISTDASNAGWGAACIRGSTGGRWKKWESSWHINEREMAACFFGLKCFASDLSNCTINVELDNTTAVWYINKKGGTRSALLNKLTRLLWLWATKRHIRLLATYRPGIQNVEADLLSRRFHDCSDYSLKEEYTRALFSRWSAPSIDLFASRWNAKCSKFFSFLPDPNASGVDAFAQEWSGIYGYAFPPFNMVGRVIRKALREGAHLILVCPKWKNQSWWPLVLEHGKEITPLKSTQDMLMDVNGLPHPCLSRPTFQLIACTI